MEQYFSVLGNRIEVFEKGEGAPLALIFGGIHGREWITCLLVQKLFEEYRGGHKILFVPSANPDGVALARYGESAEFFEQSVNTAFRATLPFLKRVNGGNDFSQWKANANAVDVNVNFPADFGSGSQNRFYPSPESYVGKYPASEPETRALMELCKLVKATVCYHSKGEVVYFGYRNDTSQLDDASKIAEATGYTLSESRNSAGGCKDWIVKNNLGFAVTVEVGADELSHPISENQLERIYEQNKNVPYILTEIAKHY